MNPIALWRRPDLFVKNARCVIVLISSGFGEFRLIEVGAFGVGSNMETSALGVYRKMEEKGFFKFGGPTTILVFRADMVNFDDDLLSASGKGLEVLVRCGEQIALATKGSVRNFAHICF